MLLYSLPDTFENFRCAIESRDVLPNPEVLKVKVLEEWDARRSKEDVPVQTAMVGYKKPPWRKPGKGRGGRPREKGNSKFKCFNCGKPGHKIADCPEKKDKEKSGATKKTEEAAIKGKENAGVLVESKEETAFLLKDIPWCLDSGASSHMSSRKENFLGYEGVNRSLSLANSESTRICGVGDIKISATDGNDDHVLRLERALHVPDLRTNLISVSKITDRGHEVLFQKAQAIIRRSNGEVLAVADRVGELYFLKRPDEKSQVAEIVPRSKLENWHFRLGHLNERSLRDLVRKDLVYGLDVEKDGSLGTCQICVKGKQSKTPFPKSLEKRTSQVLEVVHSDLCGPMRVASLSGSRYILVFTDDYSRWSEVIFLRHKNEVLEAFRDYKNRVELLTGKKIKTLQSDNGTEYCNREFDHFLRESGITRRLTVPQTPEQNGVSERKNRTLLDMARCMMLQSNLSPTFWAEAISTANYIRNRCPSRSINGEVPFTRWSGKKPTLVHLRIFGEKALTLDEDQNKGKFAARSKESIFIGYSNVSKAYRMWIPAEKKIVRSRNVKFLNEFNKSGLYEDFAGPEVYQRYGSRREVDVPMAIPLVKTREDNQEETEIPEVEKQELPEDEVRDIPGEVELKRGPGRPRLIKTGAPGRPRKAYNMRRDSEAEPILNEIEQKESANLITVSEPSSLEEAFATPYAEDWRRAVTEEFFSLVKNETWDIVDHTKNQKILGNRLVFRTKYLASGDVDRRKVRLVAKGFAQRPEVDYHETFAPVARSSSIRIIMALAVELGLEVHQMDVVTAYLHGEVEEELYMDVPEGLKESLEQIITSGLGNEAIVSTATKWVRELKSKSPKVCRIKKALYGLKQSGRQWYKKLHQRLAEMGMTPLENDPCIYVSKRNNDILIIAVYVDDLIIACNSTDWLKKIKIDLGRYFEMKDLGPIHYCLGMEFYQDLRENTIRITQTKYAEAVLRRFNMENSKPVGTPMDANNKLQNPENPSMEAMSKFPYQSLVGSLMYLAVSTRPDLAYSVSALSQFNSSYDERHWVAGKRVLRYLRGTLNLGIEFRKTGLEIEGFVDADWGSCVKDRKSYTGYVFKMAGAAVSWESRKQRTVALSSTEAEYMALSEAAKEAIYLRGFLDELGYPVESITLYNDCQGAQKLARNPVFHARTKHIDIRHHFIRDSYEQGKVNIQYLPTEEMPADVLTKGLFGPKHKSCVQALGVRLTPEKIEKHKKLKTADLKGDC